MKEEQNFFGQQFLAMREKAGLLVSRIAADLPRLTVHDITHLDALWETASLIAEPDQCLTPPEAFVFGGACLLHDAALSLGAFPGGLNELKQTTLWKDAAALVNLRGGDLTSPREGEEIILFEVLRRLHADRAADLPQIQWHSDNGDTIFLIENLEMRRYYGPSIGVLANSHWWNIAKVEHNLDRSLGPLPPYTKCSVDLLKLACLLRVADALHLDRRRAPRFLRVLHRPTGQSRSHWIFQEKLSFPSLKNKALEFTAGEAFSLSEADAWWLAYDAINLADRELRNADALLFERRGTQLAANRVEGANDPDELANSIPVTGWRPVSAAIKASDLSKLIELFGGEKLYGKELKVPLRELLQNGLDAVQARRSVQGRARNWGLITVALNNRDDGWWLAVEDTGVGMSERVLVDVLLDLGYSLWQSPLLLDEFPGLASANLKAVGLFGIGFFSVFMLGDHVKIITRRYDGNDESGLVIEFTNGHKSRPVLYPAPKGAAPIDGGTRVEVKLSNAPYQENGLLNFDRRFGVPQSLADIIEYLAPASEVTIHAVENGVTVLAVSAGDWRTMGPEKLQQRGIGLGARSEVSHDTFVTDWLKNMREMRSGDDLVGRAAICPDRFSPSKSCALVTGGMRIESLGRLAGVVMGKVEQIDRKRGSIAVDTKVLAAWASEQARLIYSFECHDDVKAECTDVILQFGGQIGELPVAFSEGQWHGTTSLRQILSGINKIKLSVGWLHDEEPYTMAGIALMLQQWDKRKEGRNPGESFYKNTEQVFYWGRHHRLYDTKTHPSDEPSYIRCYLVDLIKSSWKGAIETHEGFWKRTD